MDNITHSKIIVGSVSNSIDIAKIYGNLKLKNLYLLNIIGEFLTKGYDLSFTNRKKLESLHNLIKYNDSTICNYNKKDLTSFKGIKYCKDCNDSQVNNITLKSTFKLPIVSDNDITITENYNFKVEDFKSIFFDPNDSSPNIVKITSVPTGQLLYDGNIITEDFEFNIDESSKLIYSLTNTTFPITDNFTFKISNNQLNPLFSNMATFTINIGAAVNQPPSQVGNNSRTILNAATYTFTVDDFTTQTTPAYQDPEGDPAFELRITSLPTDGQLRFNNVPVTLNQIIPFQGTPSINAGDLVYVAEQNSPNADVEAFDFQIADSGSNVFVG